METLHELYSITEGNLALRREFIRLRESDVAALARIAPWASAVADTIAREFYDHQFAFSETVAFFERYADQKDLPIGKLREGLERAQAGYLRGIFEEAAGSGRFGVEYFEQRLHVGRLHNAINLPLKWYLGSYTTHSDLFARHLRRRFPHRPRLRASAMRALATVFNLDLQSIVEAFYYDTFATMGVDLRKIHVADAAHDLSDHGAELKRTVRDTLVAVSNVTGKLRAASAEMASTSEEAGRAVTEIAAAVQEVAAGAERQVRMVDRTRQSTQDTSVSASDARSVAEQGAAAAVKASESMRAVRDSSAAVGRAIGELAEKSEQIGGIVETIGAIAGQTNLLALNAAIEAARAGEQGRGFAVVAEEVRKLAEESRDAAESIASLIGEIQAETRNAVDVVDDGTQRTEDGVAVVEQAREAFAQISESVRAVSSQIEGIAESTNEVAAVAEQTSAATEQASAASQQTSASAEEIAASAAQLAQTAAELEELVGQFRL
jgi:methyl-accepting chemotaxis protein